MNGEGSLFDAVIRSGFARAALTDSRGKISSVHGFSIETGTSIQDSFPGIDIDSKEVQQISREQDGVKEHYRAVVSHRSPDMKEILFQETTESVNATSRLQKAMFLQSKVMKAIPDIVIIKDRDGNWLGCNSAAEKLRNSISSHDMEVPVLSPNCVDSDTEAWNSRSFYRRDETTTDGSVYDVTKKAIRRDDGSPHCLIVIARDVTETRNRERKILSLNRLVKTLRGIDKLIINSHSPEPLMTGVASMLTDSELFSSCLFRLIGPDEEFPQTFSSPDGKTIGEEVVSRLMGDVSSGAPASHGDYIASRLFYGEKDYGLIIGNPSSGSSTFDISLSEVLDDIAGDLSFALHGFEVQRSQERSAAEVLQTRNMLDAFLEHFPGPAFIRDGDSRYLKINKRLETIPGYSEWIGKNPEEIYPEKVAEQLHVRDREVIEKGYVCRVRGYVDGDGNSNALEIHYFRIDQEDGPLVGGVALDITERLNTEEALRRSEERYRAIYDNTGTSMAILDPDGTVVSANANTEVLTGYSPEEVMNRMKWTDFVHPDDRKAVAVRRSRRLRGKSDLQQEYEFRLKRKDGTYRNIRACAGTIPNSNGMGVISLSDITSLIEYQAKLDYSLSKTRAILSAIPDMMFVLSRNGEYRDFYAVDEDLLAFPADEISGKGIADIGLEEETSKRIFAAIQRTLDKGTPCSVEYDIELKDGRHFFDAGMSPFEADTVLVLCRDVTARKTAEEEQKKLEAQVRHVQKLESLGVLAGGIAHDFNNILMAITGNLYLAKRSLSDGQSPLEYLDAVDKAASRASDLAGQMLAYSGRGEFRKKSVNLNAVTEELSDILSASISKKAQLTYQLDPDIPLILADDTQIRQVVMNLMTNASEALEQSTGTIRVSTGSMFCDSDYIKTLNRTEKLKPGRYAWIEVEDTGTGMKQDLFERIFDPFFTTKFTGRGLGLSAVLGIMSSHGGALKIDSEPGKGSTFRALFPTTGKVKSAVEDAEGISSELQGAGTILFVDDEPLIRSVAETMISGIGFNVVCAADGLDGLNRFKEHSDDIELVILDLTMPNMDGDEVFREIRKLDLEIPVLISSGYNENEILARFSDMVPEGFLKKPYSVSQLAGKIRTILLV